MHVAALWLLLTLGAVFLFGAAGFFGLGYSFPLLTRSSALVASLGLAACFLILGFLLPRGELFLDGHGGRRVIVSGSYWRGKAAIALTICIICAFAALLWQVRFGRHNFAFWFGILVLGAALVAASSQTIGMAKGLRLWFHSFGNLLVACFLGICRILVRLVLGFSYAIEVLALALAAPIFVVRGRSLPSLSGATETALPKTLTAGKAS